MRLIRVEAWVTLHVKKFILSSLGRRKPLRFSQQMPCNSAHLQTTMSIRFLRLDRISNWRLEFNQLELIPRCFGRLADRRFRAEMHRYSVILSSNAFHQLADSRWSNLHLQMYKFIKLNSNHPCRKKLKKQINHIQFWSKIRSVSFLGVKQQCKQQNIIFIGVGCFFVRRLNTRWVLRWRTRPSRRVGSHWGADDTPT